MLFLAIRNIVSMAVRKNSDGWVLLILRRTKNVLGQSPSSAKGVRGQSPRKI